jgi:hypothetical protein
VALTAGQARRPRRNQPTTGGRAELVVVDDPSDVQPDGGPTVDWGLPVELPRRILEELAGTADHTVVVVRNGIVLHAPGQLVLGRTTRIASRAQRRALRALNRPGVHERGVRSDGFAGNVSRWHRATRSTRRRVQTAGRSPC